MLVADTVDERRDAGRRVVRLRDGHRRLARAGRRPRRRRRLRHRAEHAPRRDGRGGRGERQARVLREAGGRHAGADRRRRTCGTARRASSRGVGYNYRWAPLVQHARQLIDDGELGEITNYYGPLLLACTAAIRSACSRGGSSSTRPATACSTDILSHSVDLAHYLIGDITRGGRDGGDVHQAATAADRIAARTTTAASPATRPARSPTRTTSA